MEWKRSVLNDAQRQTVSAALQTILYDLIDLELQAKQAHWNLYGPQFLSIHEKLDEVYRFAGEASDTVAERSIQLGVQVDGRAASVAEKSRLETFPPGFHPVSETVPLMADRMHRVALSLRAGVAETDGADPLTEDMLTGLGEQLEKLLWMFQAVEKGL